MMQGMNPTSTSNRMLKKSASGVLASLRGSTYRGMPLGYRNHWRNFSVRQDQLKGRTAHTKCGMYLLGSSLAAALLGTRGVLARQGWAGEKSGLFEHPETILTSAPYGRFHGRFVDKLSFSTAS